MDWSWIQGYIWNLWNLVSQWCGTHKDETDAIVFLAIVGVLYSFVNERARRRKRARHILWGIWMQRAGNREALEKSIISYGICDAIEEAVYRGDMTRERADYWYDLFATKVKLSELLPIHNHNTVKKGISLRLRLGYGLKKVTIPGPSPGEGHKIDKNYKPVHRATKTGLGKSKYSSEVVA